VSVRWFVRVNGSITSSSPANPNVTSFMHARTDARTYKHVTNSTFADGSVDELQQTQMTEGAAVADEVMAALERSGVSFVGLPGKKDGSKGRGAGALQMPATVRIDIPATNPGRTALKVWEELVNVLRKDGADPAAAFVHRKKIQHAEKNIRDAFMALHRGLELLKKFRYAIARPRRHAPCTTDSVNQFSFSPVLRIVVLLPFVVCLTDFLCFFFFSFAV
jgi:hypothetical protein